MQFPRNYWGFATPKLSVISHKLIAGLRYYKGMVGKHESVILARDAQNPYDSNAIKVLNIADIQVSSLLMARLAISLKKLPQDLQHYWMLIL